MGGKEIAFICYKCNKYSGFVAWNTVLPCPHCKAINKRTVTRSIYGESRSDINRVMKQAYGVSGFRDVKEANDYLKPMGKGLAHKDEILETIRKDIEEEKKEIPLSPALEKAAVEVGEKIAKMNEEEYAAE